MGPRWTFESNAYMAANISVACLSEVSILIESQRANVISASRLAVVNKLLQSVFTSYLIAVILSLSVTGP